MTHKKQAFPHAYFEQLAWKNEQYVCGLDEVGRGCLAGPVVVAAVILPVHCDQIFADSKILSAQKREASYAWLMKNALVAVGGLDHHAIDRHNIYRATQLLMHRVHTMLWSRLPFPMDKVQFLLSDAMPLNPAEHVKHKKLEIYHFNYGESISPTVAAASIVAKVTRDRLMVRMAKLFPAYGFDKHKGYGTLQHRQALGMYEATIIHRETFMHSAEKRDDEQQISFIESPL